MVALLGFGAADLLVLNLWAVPSLITNTTTTDMRAAQSGEPPPQGAVAEPEPQPQAAVAAQPADLHAAHQPLAQADAPARVAQLTDSEQEAPAEPAAEEGAAQPAAAAPRDGAATPRGARADATPARGTRPTPPVKPSAHQPARSAQRAAEQGNGT
ncbi:MAG TPA: hypothetical protein VMF89_02235, partial [Polyangiales bacterium]|nr:hypothetical protein [Polyangiales bacterium]